MHIAEGPVGESSLVKLLDEIHSARARTTEGIHPLRAMERVSERVE
jgi:hypothetical protein